MNPLTFLLVQKMQNVVEGKVLQKNKKVYIITLKFSIENETDFINKNKFIL